jgi:drug/metabolite transporter (DMT)-like permease
MVRPAEQVAERRAAPASINLDAFSTTDWLLLSAIATTWGSSFVWIDIALEAFAPTFITLVRVAFGTATLVFFRKARTPVERADMGSIVLLGIIWMAAPFLLFPIAQQWIDSSLAGMINGSMPIFAGVVAAILYRRWPPARTMLGIIVGFAGVVAVSWPALQGSRATVVGVLLVLAATACYGVAVNIAVPLQHRYGSLPVLLRAQLVALVVVLVPGIFGASDSSFDWASLAAMIPLGCLGTALAFVWMATLVGRVGAARGSITIYFVPVVAIVLGGAFRAESIAMISLVGTALVITGAFLASRTQVAPRYRRR